MKYYGIVPASQIPRNAESKQFHHEERVHGRLVQYYEVWIKDLYQCPPVTLADKNGEPDKPKIRELTKGLRKFFRDQD